MRTGASALWRSRAREQRGLLGAIAGTVFVIAVLMAAIAGIASRAPIDAVQRTVAAGPISEVSRTVSFDIVEGSRPVSDEKVRSALEHLFAGVPVVVSARHGSNSQSWTVTPDASRILPEHLAQLRRDDAKLEGTVTALPSVDSTTVSVSGHGAATALAMERSLDAFASVLPVPAAVLVVSAVIALCLLAQLLVEARDNETRLLRARGASIRWIVGADAAEAALAAGLGALLGTLVAQLVVGLLIGAPPIGAIVVSLIGVFLGSAAIVVAFSAVAAARTSGEPRQASGRARFAVSAGLTFVVIAGAAVTMWRFITDAQVAGGPIDPLAVIAPAAGLCALAVLAVVAFGPASRGVETVTARSTGVGTLPLRSVSRHAAVFAAPVALLTIAIAVTTFAAGYEGTWSSFLTSSSRIVVGADARLDLDAPQFVGGVGDAAPLTRVAAVPGAQRVVAAATIPGLIGPLALDVVAAPSAALADLDPAEDSMFDASAVSSAVGAKRGGAGGIRLPAGAQTLELTVSAVGVVESTARLTGWLQNASGETVASSSGRFAVRDDGADEPSTATMTLPPGGPWTLSALDVSVDLPAGDGGLIATTLLTSVRLSVTGGTAGGESLPIASAGWRVSKAVYPLQGTTTVTRSGDGIGIDAHVPNDSSQTLQARLEPQVQQAPLPVAISAAAAAGTGLQVGRTTTIDLPQGSLEVRIAAIVPQIPATDDVTAVFADLPQLTAALLASSQELPAVDTVLIGVGDRPAARVADAAARAAGSGATAIVPDTTLATRFISPVITALNVGAYGCCVLSGVALAACLAALWRRRKGETVILRAIGFAPGTQARGRGVEAILAACYALVCGVVAGILISLLAGNTLARSSVPSALPSLPITGAFDVVWLAGCLVVLLVVVALIVLRYTRAVRADAVHAVPGRTTT
ncbi:FtsX-like permease family protein [Humibacter sp. RRB41]|uniref:FtsX-like permease family protein n=1 Tax=Humibacter sp. RRB41 TaxID=2919946 RepID=UPI001FAB0C11|nr:FtsX-like permease family protein [Humibacter sp. RRB41]